MNEALLDIEAMLPTKDAPPRSDRILCDYASDGTLQFRRGAARIQYTPEESREIVQFIRSICLGQK